MSLLNVAGLYVEEGGETVLRDIGFTQQQFQKIAIAGETGSGKSTLMQSIAGLVQPAAGQILFDGKQVIGPHDKLVPGHPEIAYLSQHFELPKFLRVEQVLRYANTLATGEAEKLYEICRITHLLQRRTDHLSGGERQRIALAKLLTAWPRLLLLDEPYSNLDVSHKNTLKSVIHDIGEMLDITCILISHDPQDTLSWADEIIVIKDGQLVQKGTPEQVYRQPADEYTAALFGQYNLLSGAAAQALRKSAGIALKDKSLLIRPENLHMTTKGAGIPAKVKQVKFFGSYYETDVEVAATTLTIRTVTCNVATDDTVHLAVAPDQVWSM